MLGTVQRTALLTSLFLSALVAQIIDPNAPKPTPGIDYSGSATVIHRSFFPGVCVPNAGLLLRDDQPVGQNLYVCNSTGNGWTQYSGAGLTNPMSAAGDFIVGGSGGTPQRFPVPGNGTFCPSWSSGVVSWITCPGAGGGISSIGLTMPGWFSVSGSPLTANGTLGVTAATGQTPHQFIATCGSATSFAPCTPVAADFPTLNQNTTGLAASLSAALATNLGGTLVTSPFTGLRKANGASADTAAVAGTDYVNNPTVTAGASGVTANLIATKDTSTSTQYILPTVAGTCGYGFASATTASASTFILESTPGQIYTGVADNAVTAGDILIGYVTTPGSVYDSGYTSAASIPSTTCIVGTATTSASAGANVSVLYAGQGAYGTNPSSIPLSGAVGGTAGANIFRDFVDVKDYGATGNGSTDDTTAISNAIAAIPSTGAILFFPAGTYLTSTCGFTLQYPTHVWGAGQSSRDNLQTGTTVNCKSATHVLFTVTANVGMFSQISLLNTSSTTPTAGAAIFTNSAYALQQVSYDHVSVSGFYDDIHVGVGSAWTLTNSHIQNPVRYGVYVQNTVNADNGDWVIAANYLEGGSLTTAAGSTTAAINIESSGGGKIYGNKINATYNNGIRMNATGSVQTLIHHNDIENTLSYPINIALGWPYISIIGNFLNSPAGTADIYAYGLQGAVIADNDLETYGTGTIAAAIVITNSNNFTVGTQHCNYYFSSCTSIASSSNYVDLGAFSTNAPAFSGAATFAGTITQGTYSGGVSAITVETNGSVASYAALSLCGSGLGACLNMQQDYFGSRTTGTGAVGHGLNFTGGRTGGFDNYWFRNSAGNVFGAFVDTSYSVSNVGTFATTHNLQWGGNLILVPVAVSALPTCNSGTTGALRTVSDALAPTYAVAVTGGGSVGIPVYCDGTSWKAH